MKLKWGDFVIFTAIAAIVVVMVILGVMKKPEDGLVAKILVKGEIIHEIYLDEIDDEMEFLFHDGAIKIVAQKGRIRFVKSDCPDLVCVNTGWIKKPGQIAACLPNRMLIKLIGIKDEVDVVLH